MKDINIRNIWKNFTINKKYKKYFLSSEDEWLMNLEEVKKYIEKNNKKPNENDKNKEIKYYGQWLVNQKKNYTYNINIFKNNKNIKNIWIEFINNNKYKKFFKIESNIWIIKFNEIKKYINENNKIPSSKDTDNEAKQLGIWLNHQKTNYNNNIRIMKNINKRSIWENFINDIEYKKYFLTNEEEWILNLEEVKKYINLNNNKPTLSNKNKDIKKYAKWLDNQKIKYTKNKQIMKDNNLIKNIWENFINDIKYKKYIL
jgi:hypothetical protein